MVKDDGNKNIAGKIISQLRSEKLNCSQNQLSKKLQLIGHNIDKNTVQRVESGDRAVTDIDLIAFSQVLGVSVEYLVTGKNSSVADEQIRLYGKYQNLIEKFEKLSSDKIRLLSEIADSWEK